MAFIDIVLGGLLFLGLIKGIRNGFIIELASLLSYIIGIYIAVRFSYILTNLLGNDSKIIPIIGFVLTFILVIVGVRILAKVLTKVAQLAFMGLFNRILGAIVGVIRMSLFLGVCLSVFGKIAPNHFMDNTEKESLFYKPIVACSSFVVPALRIMNYEL